MRSNHARASELVSQTASSRGCTGWSSSAAQRPIAAASSRPIRPPPTMPIRATLTPASASACSGDTPSWTTDISARVIAAGLSCWITLRP